MFLLSAAIAPSVALLYYFYLRDKYEKEPQSMLVKAFILGSIIVLPVIFVETAFHIYDLADKSLAAAGYTAFVVAGFVEETAKFLVFMLFIWRAKAFNEMYDGIVYSVFISLGFATIENIGYVLSEGLTVAFVRALTAVPAHALFGVAMGYYLGVAKFINPRRRKTYIVLALVVAIVLHGIYDFILFSQRFYLMILFVPYMIYLWKRGLNNVSELVEASPYKQIQEVEALKQEDIESEEIE